MCSINCSGGCPECDPESHVEEMIRLRKLYENARDSVVQIARSPAETWHDIRYLLNRLEEFDI